MDQIIDVVEVYIVGPQGKGGTIESATAKGLAAGAQPTVTLGGTPEDRTIELGIPKGDAGTPATITKTTAKTLPPQSEATVTMGGTASARTFEFGIPKGDPGAGSVSSVNGFLGPDVILGPVDVGGATTSTAGSIPMRGAGGAVPGVGAPVQASDAANKAYVDQLGVSIGNGIKAYHPAAKSWAQAELAKVSGGSAFKVVIMGDSQSNDGSLFVEGGKDVWGGTRGYSHRIAALLTPEAIVRCEGGQTVTANNSAGVHVWSSALAGKTSANFADAATLSNVKKIAPNLVLMMIGTNDFRANTSAATFYTNTKAAITKVLADTPAARLLFISCWPCSPPTGVTVTWRSYQDQMARIASDFATDERFDFLDFGGQFARASGNGVGSAANPWHSTLPDGIHGSPGLHRSLSEQLAEWVGLPSPAATFSSVTLRGTDLANGALSSTTPAATLILPPDPVPRQVTVKLSCILTVTSEADVAIRMSSEAGAILVNKFFHVQPSTLRTHHYEYRVFVPAGQGRVFAVHGGSPTTGITVQGGGVHNGYNDFWLDAEYA